MKRIWIGVLVFVLYLALVIAGAFALHFEGTKLVLFCVILGLVGALATVFVLWQMHKASSGSAQSGGLDTPDAVNLHALLRDADLRIREANRAGVKSLASLPLIYVIGDENSAKTQTVLQSGLDPELLAGNVYRDGAIVPTQLVNLWLAGNCILAEAGGALLRQPALWLRLIKATLPARLGSVFSKDSRLPARSVVVCVSIERILAPNTSEQIRALAQTLNERLRQLSRTLGISLPIYVLFTKLDNIAPFAEYVSHLSEEEVKLPIGSLLSSLSSGSGLYTEQATAMIGARFDQLLYALSEFRLDILSRGGELQNLARAYEFPRDLRKLRAGIISFLAEVARPSQIGINPFLRGFFFAGMRAHLRVRLNQSRIARRREFITFLGGAAASPLVRPLAARAQQPAMPVIGILSSLSSSYITLLLPPFRQGLKESGYVEGQNVAIEVRAAEGQYDRLPALAADLVDRKVAVIFATGGSDPAKAAKAATAAIPIVFISAADPVNAGIVASLNRPGGNVTGVSLLGSALEAKRLGLLHEIVPGAASIGVLVNPKYPDADLELRELQEAASAINRQINIVRAGTEPEIDTAFATVARQGAGALLVAQDPFFGSRRDQLVALAARHKLPVIYFQRDFAEIGGLVSYGTDFADAYRQAGIYVGKILKGAKPADLPVMQPTKFELVVNLKTAKVLGLAIPSGVLAIADDVIE